MKMFNLYITEYDYKKIYEEEKREKREAFSIMNEVEREKRNKN